MFVAPDVGAEASPMGKRGVWFGPVLAAVLGAVLYWQEPLRDGAAALIGG